jgi:hypothetical protein
MRIDYRGLRDASLLPCRVYKLEWLVVLLCYRAYLLYFHVIRSVSILVNASSVVPRSTHAPSPPRHDNQRYVRYRSLRLNITLNQWNTPVLLDLLADKSFTDPVIPHVSRVDSIPRRRDLFLRLRLHRLGQINIESKEEAIS